MAYIRKRRDLWTVRWRFPRGRLGQSFEHTCPDKATARIVQAEIERCIAAGRNWESRGGDSRDLCLEVILAAFLRDGMRTKSANTLKAHASAVRLFVRFLRARKPTGRLDPGALSKATLRGFWEWLRKSRDVGVNTAGRRVRLIEQAWAWAWNEDEFEEVVPRPRRIDLPRATSKLVVAPTWEEMDACVLACGVEWHRQLVTVARYTGLRSSQIMRLRWDDLDLGAKELRIRPELGKSQQERSGRVIPVSDHLVEEVAGWGRRDGYIVGSGRTGAGQRVGRGRDLARAGRRAGVREEVWAAPEKHQHGRPIHAFRAGLISELLREGYRQDAVTWLVGQKLRGVIGSHYLDVRALPLRETVRGIRQIGPQTASGEGPVRADLLARISK